MKKINKKTVISVLLFLVMCIAFYFIFLQDFGKKENRCQAPTTQTETSQKQLDNPTKKEEIEEEENPDKPVTMKQINSAEELANETTVWTCIFPIGNQKIFHELMLKPNHKCYLYIENIGHTPAPPSEGYWTVDDKDKNLVTVNACGNTLKGEYTNGQLILNDIKYERQKQLMYD